MILISRALMAGCVVTLGWWTPLSGQVQVRLGNSTRATYSELHEALKLGSPAADTVRAILTSRDPRRLWQRMHAAIEGTGDWNSALLALTRLAELRVRAYADSARVMRQRLTDADFAPFPNNPGLKAEDLEPSLQAVLLEWQRKMEGDSAVLADILRRIPAKDYNHGDAWVLGRLGAGARDSVVARFRTADTEEFRVRYLTLLSYFTDHRLIPLLSSIYVAPDSFGIPKRYGIRASDGLLWIGTRESMQALLDARAEARRRRVYADSSLARGGYDFLANDSSSVISRTGKWLSEWVATLGTGKVGRTGKAGRLAGGPSRP
ncbi:MAG TPA: hypothetical protein VHH32_08375 [Gemmatimonadales bacterium]|nr:hypothetical protein [Gemmatimonadales bacterium]